MEGAWRKHKTVYNNFKDMGLSANPNVTLGIPNSTKQRIQMLANPDTLGNPLKLIQQQMAAPKKKSKKTPVPHGEVAQKLETNANALRESGFRYSKGQTALITYYMDKYQLNYKAMVRDPKNYEQETWKQLRNKIRRFLDIPEHVNAYLKERNMERLTLEENSDEDSD